ncbi:MAG: hypothetical protein KGQ47_10130 [Hyphomicrobiales bacterium]|nr:hypothetical protein [Hyphomicrobiales bacterium]MDE2374202.1 hypothetical protein [Hyphomicrobiales bacterium]
MTAHAYSRDGEGKSRSVRLMLAAFAIAIAAAATFVSYILWPTWPEKPVPLDAPSIPVTVAGVLFDVPPAAVRVPVQRHPGEHERIDLMFLWPSLIPPRGGDDIAKPAVTRDDEVLPVPTTDKRLFVSIAPLGSLLSPDARLRTIYPRYIESEAAAGPDGLAILPFRTGTPYEGEDLVYFAEKPEQFFARCSRPVRTVPGTCIHERALGAAEITLRFPREWLHDWHQLVADFDRLIAQLHPAK